MLCECGCKREAVSVVSGFAFDPRAEGDKGKPFESPACNSYLSYLEEASHELGLPISKRPANG